MSMRRFSVRAVLLSLLAAAGALADASPQRVVYHINSGDAQHQSSVLRSMQNHLDEAGSGNVEMHLVLHGNGVSLLLLPEALTQVDYFTQANATSSIQVRIENLKVQGVVFKVCDNTLKRHKVDRKRHLFDVAESDLVRSGIGELARLQGMGFTYIKP
ncbi:MAG: DsrE family protein [Gammaproteobacteria bacterium]|nr:DsrE family protein [Gammaproteobacteria bacterium]